MQRAHEVLYYVGLGEARYRNVETYSTGMKQRIKLAQALVHDPDLLFLDEPTNGMDPKGRDEMLELDSRPRAQQGRQPDPVVAPAAGRRIHLRPRRRARQGRRRGVGADRSAEGAGGPRLRSSRQRRSGAVHRARWQAAGMECHETDEDVMRVFVPGSVGDGRRRSAAHLRDRAAMPACRSGTCAPACRRSKTSSRARLVRNESRSTIRATAATKAPGSRSGRGWSVILSAGHAGDARARSCSSGCCVIAWIPFIVRTVQIYVVTMYPQAAQVPCGRRRRRCS